MGSLDNTGIKKVSLGISQLIESIICDALYQKGVAYDHC
jgi:hypothetical protein